MVVIPRFPATQKEFLVTSADSEVTLSGRNIYGPTPPGKAVWCARTTPLAPAEMDEVVELVVKARLGRKSAILPERLWTRHWDSIMMVVLRVNDRLGWKPAGWKIGAASTEVQKAEGLPGPAPGRLHRHGVHASPARLSKDLFINYRNSECEFAFRLGADLPPRSAPYAESDVAAAIESLMPAVEIGDTIFEDWYGASAYLGSCLDNGGAAAFVHGPPIRDWQRLDLPNARIDLHLNGRFIKSGYGRAAMGHPLTSLTWLANWLRKRGLGLAVGEIVSTGTCTGHFFAAPGDRLDVEFGPLGRVVVDYL
jgi:2-oxo-hept-3-ene-1,7-dioate hydratase